MMSFSKIGVPLLAGISTELRTMLAVPESAATTPMVSCAIANELVSSASIRNVKNRQAGSNFTSSETFRI